MLRSENCLFSAEVPMTPKIKYKEGLAGCANYLPKPVPEQEPRTEHVAFWARDVIQAAKEVVVG